MARFRRHDDPNQGFLLPPSPRDWLPQGHLAWFISDTVDQLNLDALLDRYRECGKGELAYDPRILLKLLVYGYATGVVSSRKIAIAVEESVAFRVLGCGSFPNHRTVCRFREEHLDLFESLFVQILQIAREAGMVRMGTIAIDGSKVKANASKHKAMSYGRMIEQEKKLTEEIRKLARAAKHADAIEDGEFGPDFRGDELPKEIARREDRLATIRAAKKRLEERKAAEAKEAQVAEAEAKPSEDVKPEPKDQENFTDPESRIMKTGGASFEQSYNAQIAVDAKAQIIVATKVSQCASDAGHLVPVVNEVFENTGVIPPRVIADSGYRSEANFQLMTDLGIDAHVPLGREGKVAPAPRERATASARMAAKLRTKRGRRIYKLRKAIVEPVFGWVKRVLGFRSFSLRGLKKVTGEWSLVCLALNLRRMRAAVAGK